jgi:hypothetical protein
VKKVPIFTHGTGLWTQGFMLARQALYYWSCTSSLIYSDYSGDGALGTICPGWPPVAIHLISVSQVVRITGVSHTGAQQTSYSFISFPSIHMVFMHSFSVLSENTLKLTTWSVTYRCPMKILTFNISLKMLRHTEHCLVFTIAQLFSCSYQAL